MSAVHFSLEADAFDAHDLSVVTNDALQYSIWPSDRALPGGWRHIGFRGARDACLEYIDGHWSDLSPAPVRRHFAAQCASRIDPTGRLA